MPQSPSNGEREFDGRSGHRARLTERFARGGIDALHDYEIVELLLTYAIPRRDTKPLAKELIRRYGQVSTILTAPVDELRELPGMGHRAAHLMILMREIMAYCLREKFERKPVMSHRKDVDEYLRFHYGYRGYEYFAALFLDNGHHVISTEMLMEGTASQCTVYPRRIIERALHHKASSIIVAHNHPGGSVKPSEADWAITTRLAQLGKLLDMPLIDHIIISREQIISLKESPLWPRG